MSARSVMLKKQRSSARTKLEQLRTKRAKLRADEEKLQKQVEELEEITPELEEQVNNLTDEQTQTDEQIIELTEKVEKLTDEIEKIEDDPAVIEDEDEETKPKATVSNTGRSAGSQPQTRSAGYRCRSRCFGSRSQRDAFYSQPTVRDFIADVRSKFASGRRSINGAELTIPDVVLDVIRDNLDEYSKLLLEVRLRHVAGTSRQHIIGDIPEGVWMEMDGVLNNLEFVISDVEMDGYKVGGVIVIDNFLLKDNDINLGEEIIYMLAQSIGYAIDKAIVYGKGPGNKMPVGVVPRLAQTSKPSYWSEKRRPWVDLHTSNIIKLDLAAKNGAEFFVPLLQALRKPKKKKMAGERVWLMNESTRDDLLIRALGFNAAATIVSGMDNTMPILGGKIITLDFIPDYQIVGGYMQTYLLVEREGGTFSNSDQALFIEDKTVFKGTARYDGQPVFGECFVAVCYSNQTVTTAMDFAIDFANTDPNVLVVTSSAGASGKTKLTVAGVKSSSNALYAKISGTPVPVENGEALDTKKWTKITSGSTSLDATTGQGATVVEVDSKNRTISVGYLPSVTAGA